jgi:hypothetical protein
MPGAWYEVDSEGPRVETWNWVLGEFRQIRKFREFRKSAISGEFEAALLDVQSLDGSTPYETELIQRLQLLHAIPQDVSKLSVADPHRNVAKGAQISAFNRNYIWCRVSSV